MDGFLTRQLISNSFEATKTEYWRSFPEPAGLDLSFHVEQILGDALRWAQACAMVQPVSLGLADRLREFLNKEFELDLAPERIERLFSLHGTNQTVSGLYFSRQVLRILRLGFQKYWTEKAQNEILKFIIEIIDESKPDNSQKDSLCYLTWNWIRERVRLELEPDSSLRNLYMLARTPLGDSIRAELENTDVTEVAKNNLDIIPLRRDPKTQKAKKQLKELTRFTNNDNLLQGIGKHKQPRIKKRRWWIAALLGILATGLGQLYNGQPRKGLLFSLFNPFNIVTPLTHIVSIPIPIFIMINFSIAFPFNLILFVLFVLIGFAILIDAIIIAKQQGTNYQLKDCNKWYQDHVKVIQKFYSPGAI